MKTAIIAFLGFLMFEALSSGPVWAQTTNFTLGTSSLLVGPAAGSNTVVLAVTPGTAPWTATTNAAWLHLDPANQGGVGSTNILFSFDANPGATRVGTLTIAGQILTVTQAGSSYVSTQAGILLPGNVIQPFGMAVDGADNVYIASSYQNGSFIGSIYKWSPATQTETVVISGLIQPNGVALDTAGNLYIVDTSTKAIYEWVAANSNLITLVSSGLSSPGGIAVDGSGNVYVTDLGSNTIKEWSVANSNLTTLVSSGLVGPRGVAVDVAGNLYITDTAIPPGAGTDFVKKWTAATGSLTTLIPSSGLSSIVVYGIAVDGSGNLYLANGGGALQKWTAANNTSTQLQINSVWGVAVDGNGDVYGDEVIDNGLIYEQPYAFVDPTAKFESAFAGTDALGAVVPATANLLPPFNPSSDQSWLTITGVTNGVVSYSFTENPNSTRTGHIALLGQSIPVTQIGPAYSTGTGAILVGPTAGSNSVVLAVYPNFGPWTNTANTNWLHLDSANLSGIGSTNVVFTYDANPGATRSGSLTIAGQTLTITQAGSTYVAAGPIGTLVATNLANPFDVTVGASGNVYIADT